MRYLLIGLLFWPLAAQAQLVQQSDLDFDDVDPGMELTIDHLTMSTRWMGVSPREVTWSPDGRHVYFRWHPDPEHDQNSALDPWFRVDAAGTAVEEVANADAALIPAFNIDWAANRSVAAWSRGSSLFVWDAAGGTRPVITMGRGLNSIRVSADGGHVFFAQSAGNSESSDLWLYDTNSGQIRQVARAGAKKSEPSENAAWLEEQQLELLEYVRTTKENSEAAAAIGRERSLPGPQMIPVEKNAVLRNLQLTPDGRHVTFQWQENPGNQKRTEYLEYVNESGEATAQDARPKVGEPLPTYRMGVVAVDPMVKTEDVEITWVNAPSDKKSIIHGPYWNPQGTHAAVQILSMDHKDRWIALLDVETGETTVLDHQHEEAWIGGPLVVGRWAPGFIQWLPDGDGVAFASTANGWAMLYVADLDGTVTPVTQGEWEVRDVELAPDGSGWYLTTSQQHPGEQHLYFAPLRGGNLQQLTMREGKYQASISPDGTMTALLFADKKSQNDLFLMANRAEAEEFRVTKSGTDEFYRYDWASNEIISYSDAQGEEAWAMIWEAPANPNQAAVVYAHGCGECAQGVDKGWTRISARLYANYIRQLGYTAASVDYRGSSGYGHANRTYAYRQMGISDIDSALPLLDILATNYGVDASRIGVYGGSYGGFFTLMSLFRHPGRYAAGVAMYPVTDWAHYNQGYTSRILNGSQLDDEEAYRQSSPMYYAEGLQDALQIQHGLVDGNVQIQDSYRLAQLLMELDKDFELVTYPVEPHGWRQPASRRDSYKRMTKFFDTHLLGPRTIEGGR